MPRGRRLLLSWRSYGWDPNRRHASPHTSEPRPSFKKPFFRPAATAIFYRAANFFGVIVVLDHAVDVLDQLAIFLDIIDAAGVHHVADALGGTVVAREDVS